MTFLALQIEMENLDWAWQHLMWVTAKETKFLWKSTARFQSLFPQFCLTPVLGNCPYWGYHHVRSKTVYIFMSSSGCQRRQWHPTPVLLPGKSHGWRSLEGCSPWGCWGPDTTEPPHFHFSLSCTEEGNGNPLQCSCLENPRDGGSLVGGRLWGCTESDTTEVT